MKNNAVQQLLSHRRRYCPPLAGYDLDGESENTDPSGAGCDSEGNNAEENGRVGEGYFDNTSDSTNR